MDCRRNLQAWIEKTKNVLADKTRPVDIASAEDLLKKHYELKEDIDSKKYEFEYVRDLGKRLLQKNPSLNEVSYWRCILIFNDAQCSLCMRRKRCEGQMGGWGTFLKMRVVSFSRVVYMMANSIRYM